MAIPSEARKGQKSGGSGGSSAAREVEEQVVPPKAKAKARNGRGSEVAGEGAR
jgi:hypothetical protein